MVEVPRRTRHLGRAVIAGVVVVGVVVVGAILAVGTATADPEVAAVRNLAADTLILEHRIGVPDSPNAAAIMAAESARLHADAEAKANARYKGPLLAMRIRQFNAAVDQAVTGRVSGLDGGAKDIVFGETTVGPDTATVHLRATTWATSSVNGKVTSPMSTDNWTFFLQKVDGQWFVTDTETDFHG
ncbi:MAG TPA: hypothetical protein VFY18_05465 [Candidatus Limnocylindrales bacterium]|nr:hypothetical protein [Candidatus Limnocylindrales bacterium]